MTAKDHGLWFPVTLPNTETPILPQLHEAIMAHFSPLGLVFPPAEDDEPVDVTDFGTLPWQLIKIGKKPAADSYTMRKDIALHAGSITHSRLQSLTKGCFNPETPENRWIIISKYKAIASIGHALIHLTDSRNGDLIGPICRLGPFEDPIPPLQYLRHPCFGNRFTFKSLPASRRDSIQDMTCCLERCPDEQVCGI